MAVMTAVAGFLENGKQFVPLIERLQPADKKRGHNPLEAALHIFNNNDHKALAACARSFPRLSVSDEQFQAARPPALAVVGDKDLLKVTVDELKKVMPNLKVELVEGTDHGSTLRSAKFVDDIQAFIESHSTAPKAPTEQR